MIEVKSFFLVIFRRSKWSFYETQIYLIRFDDKSDELDKMSNYNFFLFDIKETSALFEVFMLTKYHIYSLRSSKFLNIFDKRGVNILS